MANQKFEDVQPPLAAFHLGNEGLWPLQALGHGLLGQASFTPSGKQQRAQRLMFGVCRDFVSPRAFLTIRPRRVIPDSDYPKLDVQAKPRSGACEREMPMRTHRRISPESFGEAGGPRMGESFFYSWGWGQSGWPYRVISRGYIAVST